MTYPVEIRDPDAIRATRVLRLEQGGAIVRIATCGMVFFCALDAEGPGPRWTWSVSSVDLVSVEDYAVAASELEIEESALMRMNGVALLDFASTAMRDGIEQEASWLMAGREPLGATDEPDGESYGAFLARRAR